MPIIILCPSCHRQLRVPDELLGREVKCPTCSAIFTASAESEAAVPPPPPREEEPPRARAPGTAGPPADEFAEAVPPLRRRRRPRREDDHDDEGYEDDYDDEPRPRRPRQRPRDLVAGPALALMVVGSIVCGLSVVRLLCGLGGAAGAWAFPGPGFGGPNPVVLMMHLVSGVLGAIFFLCWGGIILSAAVQMKNLRSYGYALTGAIAALVPCLPCCLFSFPFGIWALVVLNQPEVKDAFR